MGHEARAEDEIADEEAIEPVENQKVHLEVKIGRVDIAIDAPRPTEARRKERKPAVYWPEKVAEECRNRDVGDCRPWAADGEKPGTSLSVHRNNRRYKIEQIEGAG
jgi:sRNA-binding carbon storage regulator CsrA